MLAQIFKKSFHLQISWTELKFTIKQSFCFSISRHLLIRCIIHKLWYSTINANEIKMQNKIYLQGLVGDWETHCKTGMRCNEFALQLLMIQFVKYFNSFCGLQFEMLYHLCAALVQQLCCKLQSIIACISFILYT